MYKNTAHGKLIRTVAIELQKTQRLKVFETKSESLVCCSSQVHACGHAIVLWCGTEPQILLLCIVCTVICRRLGIPTYSSVGISSVD